MKVIIDNGHGENTPGKRSLVLEDGRQLFEWAYTREIARRVHSELTAKGVDVELLVRENIDVSLSERTRRENKITAKYGKSKTICVSIHCNAKGHGDTWEDARGWSVFVSPNASNNSKKLATYFADTAQSLLPKIRKPMPNQPYWVQNLAICRDTNCPTVLTENLFMDNEQDCKFLLSPEGKSLIVKLHIDAILKYIRI